MPRCLMKNRSLLSFILANALSISVAGQNPSPTPSPKPAQNLEDVVRITTNLVQIDAAVTDKTGKAVTDLKAEDFEVFEDGRPQKITNFSFVSVGSSTASPSPAAARRQSEP